ncbi:GML isoform 1, partial [Pan troglodytes]
MLLFALLLAMELPLVAANATMRAQWTYSLRCHDCAVINDFNCPNIRVCPYHIRRCMTISIQLSSGDRAAVCPGPHPPFFQPGAWFPTQVTDSKHQPLPAHLTRRHPLHRPGNILPSAI